MHNPLMNRNSSLDQTRILRQRVTDAGLTQIQIAQATGLSQSQVSRLLAGHGRLQSKGFQQICKYVSSYTPSISQRSLLRQSELMTTLAEVWDGTPAHADALSTVLRSLKLLRISLR